MIFSLRWPDWQLTSVFTRGFKVAGMAEPSNVYPRIAPGPGGSIEEFLEPEDADAWNCRLEHDLRPCEFDGSVFDTTWEQSIRGLLSKPMARQDVDARFGKGAWRGIRRRGIR